VAIGFGAASNIIASFKADTKQYQREVKKLGKSNKEAAATLQRTIDKNEKMNAGLDKQIAILGKVAIGVTAAIAAYKGLVATAEKYAETARMLGAAEGANIQRIQEASGGLLTRMEALHFAAAVQNSDFKLSQEEMELTARWMRELVRQGNDLEEVQREVTKSLVEGTVEGVKKFGTSIRDVNPGIEAHGALLQRVREDLQGVASDAPIAGEEIRKASVRWNDSVDRLSVSLGKAATMLTPVVEMVNEAVEGFLFLMGMEDEMTLAERVDKVLAEREKLLESGEDSGFRWSKVWKAFSLPTLLMENKDIDERKVRSLEKIQRDLEGLKEEAKKSGNVDVLTKIAPFSGLSLSIKHGVMDAFTYLVSGIEERSARVLDEREREATRRRKEAAKRREKASEKLERLRTQNNDTFLTIDNSPSFDSPALRDLKRQRSEAEKRLTEIGELVGTDSELFRDAMKEYSDITQKLAAFISEEKRKLEEDYRRQARRLQEESHRRIERMRLETDMARANRTAGDFRDAIKEAVVQGIRDGAAALQVRGLSVSEDAFRSDNAATRTAAHGLLSRVRNREGMGAGERLVDQFANLGPDLQALTQIQFGEAIAHQASLAGEAFDTLLVGADALTQGMTAAFGAWIDGEEISTKMLRAMTGDALKAMAMRMFARSLEEFGLGLAASVLNPALAGSHFAASAYLGAGATAVGALARSVGTSVSLNKPSDKNPMPKAARTTGPGRPGKTETTIVVPIDPFNDDPRSARRRLSKAMDRARRERGGSSSVVSKG